MSDVAEPHVLVIMGSTRAARHCPVIAEWVMRVMAEPLGLPLRLVDLRERPLSDDEPSIPATGEYRQETTRAWSREVADASGFVIVTPQYNWGYPAPLKNALDHVYREWAGKPLALVTYGGHGGGKCAEQLLQVADALKLEPVPMMPAITLTEAMIHGGPIAPEHDFTTYAEDVRTAATQMRCAVSRKY